MLQSQRRKYKDRRKRARKAGRRRIVMPNRLRKACTLLLGMAIFITYFNLHPPETLYDREFSPDGKYVVEYYKLPWFALFVTPGHGSDAPVSMYLKSTKGRIIKRWDEDLMMQNAGPAEWYDEYVILGAKSYRWTDSDQRID